jgi:hypothetical protein
MMHSTTLHFAEEAVPRRFQRQTLRFILIAAVLVDKRSLVKDVACTQGEDNRLCLDVLLGKMLAHFVRLHSSSSAYVCR